MKNKGVPKSQKLSKQLTREKEITISKTIGALFNEAPYHCTIIDFNK